MQYAGTYPRALFSFLLLLFVLTVQGLEAQTPSAATDSAPTPPPFKMPEQFSVDITFTASGNTVKSTIYVAKDKSRRDTETRGGKQGSILRQDLKKRYDLFYKVNRYIEEPYNKDLSKLIFGLPAIGRWEKQGTEPIDGKDTSRYLCSTVNDAEALYYWVDPATQCPVKIEAKIMTPDGSTQTIALELTNYKIEAQPDSVFELPADFKPAR